MLFRIGAKYAFFTPPLFCIGVKYPFFDPMLHHSGANPERKVEKLENIQPFSPLFATRATFAVSTQTVAPSCSR